VSTSNEILLKGEYHPYEEAKIKSGQTIKPGMAVDLDSSGLIIVPAASGKAIPKRVMLINTWTGKTKTDAWTAEELAKYIVPKPGSLINLLCLSGETINIGTQVIINTAGKGIATTGSPAQTFGESEEAGGTLTADTFLAVRVS